MYSSFSQPFFITFLFLMIRFVSDFVKQFSYFFRYYEELEKNTFFESYKKRIMWIGEKINIISPSGTVPAFLTGINDDCGLLVKYADGTEGVVTSGEISIRKKL